MAAIRAYSAGMSGSVLSRIRAYEAGMSGVARVVPRIRAYRIAVSGVASVVVADMAARSAGPGQVVSVTAALVGGGAADSWTWRQISGPAIGMNQVGATVSFTAPSLWPPGSDVVLGARGQVGSTQSPEKTVTITVLPQLEWSRVHGGQWVGAVVAPV